MGASVTDLRQPGDGDSVPTAGRQKRIPKKGIDRFLFLWYNLRKKEDSIYTKRVYKRVYKEE